MIAIAQIFRISPLRRLLALGLSGLCCCSGATTLTFLHVDGQNILNERGEKIILRGVGLGNWLLPEGYMWKFGSQVDRPRRIERLVEDLLGKESATRFWADYRKNYITEADIRQIAS